MRVTVAFHIPAGASISAYAEILHGRAPYLSGKRSQLYIDVRDRDEAQGIVTLLNSNPGVHAEIVGDHAWPLEPEALA